MATTARSAAGRLVTAAMAAVVLMPVLNPPIVVSRHRRTLAAIGGRTIATARVDAHASQAKARDAVPPRESSPATQSSAVAMMESLEQRLLLNGDPLAQPYIIDDGDAAFTTTGEWAITAGAGHAGDIRTITGGAGTATWTFSDVCPGYYYRISATWTPAADRAADTAVTLVDHLNTDAVNPEDRTPDATLGVLHVDQRTAPDDRLDAGSAWEDLDVVLVRGTALSVTLSGAPDAVIVADGVRIERLGTWQPPLGVPSPEFGVDQSHWMYTDPQYTYDYGAGPEPYRVGAKGPYTHYVDNTHPDATDTDNALGTPDRPRLTLPLDLTPGSVVEVHGGPYTYHNYMGPRLGITGTGTAARPIFIRGTGHDAQAVFANEVRVRGSYMVLEYFRTDSFTDPDTGTLHEGLLRVLNPSDHLAFRRGEASNLAPLDNGFRAIWAIVPVKESLGGNSDSAFNDNIVFYDNHVHHNTPAPEDESGLHAICPSGNSRQIWIVDNHMEYNGEDGVQVFYSPAYADHVADHIYIGRNVMHHNGENAVDIKQSSNVIISENLMYGYVPVSFPNGSGSDGVALAIHYQPVNVWVLANEIYDSYLGMRSNGTDAGYVIGNLIHDIHPGDDDDYDPDTIWQSSTAIIGWSNPEFHIACNTIYDVHSGISIPGGGDQSYFIHNNIIANLAQPSHHLGFSVSNVAEQSLVTHNLFYQPDGGVRIKWAGGTATDVAGFQAAAGDRAWANLETDPRFVDAPAGDFRPSWPTSPSPAVDAGTGIQAYVDLFDSLYGVDIAKDVVGVARPQRNGIDIGAFEAANTAPQAVDDAWTTAEDTFLMLLPLVNDTDAEGDTLSIADFAQPSHGTVERVDDTRLRYIPHADWYGTDTFTYTVSDGMGGTATATVTITVTPVNDAPRTQDDDAVTPEDTPVIINVLDNDTDVEDDPLTIVDVTQPAHGAVVDVGDGALRYTPDDDWHGTDRFTYAVSDGQGGTAEATVTVTVDAVNDPPQAADDSAVTAEDTSVAIDVLANDSDVENDPLIFAPHTQPSHGTVSRVGEHLVYVPEPDWFGTDQFIYAIADGMGGTDTATVTITVTPVNDAPRTQDDDAVTPEDTPVIINVLDNDTDVEDDPLTIVDVTQPAHGAVVEAGDGALRYTPDDNWHGTDRFTYTAGDGHGGTATATVTVTVQPVNDPPRAVDDDVTTDEDAPVTVFPLLNDTDVDGDVLSIVDFTQPSHGTVRAGGNGALIYTPADDWFGTDQFTYTAGDGTGSTDSATVTVEVAEAPYVVALDDRGQTTFTDGAGNTVVVNLRGPGTGQVYFPDEGDCDMRRLVLRDTTGRSSLLITSRGWDRHTTIGEVSVDGSLAALVGRDVDLLGDLTVQGSLSKLVLDDVHDARITVGADKTYDPLLTVTLGRATDTSLVSALALRTLVAADWIDTDGHPDAIEAPWLGAMTIRGQRGGSLFGASDSRGDFDAALTLTDTDRRGNSLGRLSITGRLAADMVLARGLGAIQAAQWDDGSLQATTLGTLVVRRSFLADDLDGHLSASIDLVGTFPRGGLSLRRMQVTGAVTDAEITLAGGARTLAASQWNGGSLTAETITSLAVQGRWDSDTLRGDFSGALTLTGAHRRSGLSLARFVATGTVTAPITDGAPGDGETDDASISLAGGAGAVLAGQWHVPAMAATTVKRFTVAPTVWSAGDVAGGFSGVLDLSGESRAGVSLGALTVAGALDSATVRTAGSIGTLAAGALVDSDILAGCREDVERHADDDDDFVDDDAMIRSVFVRGVATSSFGAADRFFRNSNLSAARFGVVRLVNPALPNDTDFGLWARHAGRGEIRAFVCTDDLTGTRWHWRPGRTTTTTGEAFREQNLVVYLV
ncbi:MAG: Ig-like domain-containing protein [Planctomycetota bacterium]